MEESLENRTYWKEQPRVERFISNIIVVDPASRAGWQWCSFFLFL